MAAVWITNPATVPIIYLSEYKFGSWIFSFISLPEMVEFNQPVKETGEIMEMMDVPKNRNFFKMMKNARYLLLGSLVFSTVFSLIVYGGFRFLFKRLELRRLKRKQALGSG